MKLYLISLATGALVGIIYSLLNVRSPAPPVIALLGLLGMLVGEQVVPAVKRMVAGEPITMTWFRTECVPKITGAPPATVKAFGQTEASDVEKKLS
ncbi:XapX domain-containing protein [Noviherbaspirillum aerium]|uniref:XapX domain-containing protein n=1 Tax=Noviherbaspirillum aerium TaxID=2588497 RepID=UPI00124C8260|nr:XapX domain-containing protein [Noviherbaspirillum aerium]